MAPIVSHDLKLRNFLAALQLLLIALCAFCFIACGSISDFPYQDETQVPQDVSDCLDDLQPNQDAQDCYSLDVDLQIAMLKEA